jgi:nitrous oxidase accessory protein NosD
MRVAIGHFAMACTLLVASSCALPASAIESRPVRFAKGASAATLKGSLKGEQIIDYTLRAKAGQTMSITLKTSNLSNYVNVLPPGSKDVAMFVGSTSGNEWTGPLAADGD